MNLSEITFKRRFSVNPYRELRLDMGYMSMHKNWAEDRRGDPYPIISRKGDICENVCKGRYEVSCSDKNGGEVRRLLGSFFPWATYELSLSELSNSAEASFWLKGGAGELIVNVIRGGVALMCEEGTHFFAADVTEKSSFALTFRTGGVSGYLDGKRLFDLSLKMMDKYRRESLFEDATVSLHIRLNKGEDKVSLNNVKWYLCGGISHADIKPVKYEDGTPMMERGRVFLTVTSRTERSGYQSVISWNPTLCDFKMEGAVFFDAGDGIWCADVASSLVFDRRSEKWLIWMASFSHGHVLGRGECGGDPRFGINLVRVTTMERKEGAKCTDFVGFGGDEDPDLVFFDGKWHLTVCRLEDKDGYHYYHFVSDEPFDNFTFADRTLTHEKTGGMFVKTDDGYVFVCGSDFSSRARYDVYAADDFSHYENLKCNYDDGGFRGWGSLMLLDLCGRKRWYWITFDRHNASDYNWSYGNLYVFEGRP